MEFLGYPRENGAVGVRNYVVVIPTVNCVNYLAVKIAEKTKGVLPLPHIGTCGFMGKDKEMLFRTLVGLGKNPNVGGVLVVGMGCEIISPEEIATEIASTGKPTEVLTVKKRGSADEVNKKGIEITKKIYHKVSKIKREKVDLSKLTVAVKCGGSDITSGLSSNPVTGRIADKIVAEGGTVLFTETAELIGAEKVLAKRAVNKEVADKIYKIVNNKEQSMMKMGVDIRRCEPTPGNIQGGLTTIEEKSLGAIAKSGSTPIKDVIEWGDIPFGKGLFLMDGSALTSVIYPGVASAGAQVLIFSIGGGVPRMLPMAPANSARFPIMPVIKLTGNPYNFNDIEKKYIDIYVGSIIEGKEKIEEAASRAFKEFLKKVSGEEFTVSETFTEYIEPMNLYFTGPIV